MALETLRPLVRTILGAPPRPAPASVGDASGGLVALQGAIYRRLLTRYAHEIIVQADQVYPVNEDQFYPLVGAFIVNNSAAQTNKTLVEVAAQRDMTLTRLKAMVHVAPASTFVITLFKNGVATTLTITVASTNVAGDVISDLTHSVAVSAGDRLCYLFRSSVGGYTPAVHLAVEEAS